MSDQNFATCDLSSPPSEIDCGSYLRICQVRPVERAISPIIDHNIELTELAHSVRPWYRGDTRIEPADYMSIVLNPARNRAAHLLAEFTDTVKEFPPGGFPAHCHAVRDLEFTTKHLICTLSTLIEAAVFAGSLRCLGAFFAAVSDPANMMMSKHDLVQRIDARLEALVDSFRLISREFAMREREVLFSRIPVERDTAADEILALARDTNDVVKRIDARDVKRGRRQAEIDRQEKCWAIWEAGRQKEAVFTATNGKVSYSTVFDYCKRELKDIGVTSSKQFSQLLSRRHKRLSYRSRK